MTSEEYAEIYHVYTGGWQCGFFWGFMAGSCGAIVGTITGVLFTLWMLGWPT